MKRFLMVMMAVMGLVLMGSMCDTDEDEDGGGGGGFMSMGDTEKGVLSWEMIFTLPVETECPGSIVQSGAYAGAVSEAGESYFYHVPVVLVNGYDYYAEVPEFYGLAYMNGPLPPGETDPPGPAAPALPSLTAVSPGDLVTVHYQFQSDMDARNGDFFEVRVYDGTFMMRPTFLTSYAVGNNLSPLEQARGQVIEVNYSFTAMTDTLGIIFMAGLSSAGYPSPPYPAPAPPDRLLLDDLIVTVNGAVALSDDFEAGDYTMPGLAGMFQRMPLVPRNPVGGMALDASAPLAGANSLGYAGGRYFILEGLGVDYEGQSLAMLSLSDPNTFDPFFGEVRTVAQYGMLAGRYAGWSRAVPDTPGWCTEGGLEPFPPLSEMDANIMIGSDISLFDLLAP